MLDRRTCVTPERLDADPGMVNRPELLHLDAARTITARPVKSRLGRGVLVAGLVLIPWACIMACSLPSSTRAAHWSTAWAGLDGLEAVALIATGVALVGRYRWLCLPAAVASTALIIDAWFDVTTSAPGRAVAMAIAMALFSELPMAGLCAVLAISNARQGAWVPVPSRITGGRGRGSRAR